MAPHASCYRLASDEYCCYFAGSRFPRQQQDAAHAAQAHALPQLQLPAAFLQLQQQYASLDTGGTQASGSLDSSVTSAAAADFLQQLDAAYTATSPQHNQLPPGSAPGAGMQQLGVHAFAAQAHFVGLVSAVLRAVQVRPGHSLPMPCAALICSWLNRGAAPLLSM
jgi:hypothetical protein